MFLIEASCDRRYKTSRDKVFYPQRSQFYNLIGVKPPINFFKVFY